jgi:hypothetical protein
MAYYTNLIAAWNGATQPPTGVAGTGITAQMTTAQKIAAVNGWTITGSIPTSFLTTGPALLNCINWAEFNALTAQQQSNLLMLCASPGPILGGSANVGLITAGMFLAYFTNHSGPTILALMALAQGVVQQWWAAPNGGALNGPVSAADCTAAGLS